MLQGGLCNLARNGTINSPGLYLRVEEEREADTIPARTDVEVIR